MKRFRAILGGGGGGQTGTLLQYTPRHLRNSSKSQTLLHIIKNVNILSSDDELLSKLSLEQKVGDFS